MEKSKAWSSKDSLSLLKHILGIVDPGFLPM